jgi:cytoskeletal protein CcmA (bactofilin family)
LDFDTSLFHTFSRQATVALLFASPDFLSRKWRVRIASGDLLPPSPPAEKATARQDQPWKSCADDGGGDCQEYPPRCGHDLSGEQNSYISTVIEGRGAQEMVALVLRRRIGPIRALHPHNRRKQEVDMLISTKSGAPEKDKNGPVSAADVMGRVVPHDQTWARSEPTTKAGTASCIGSDMSIVGKIDCNGPAQVFGRIEGEVRASDLQISDGAQVEGNVIAQTVTVCGRVKGTIRADRVKLQNGGAVEGDIFHRTLSIDENSQFEGSSRRVENPMEPSASVDAKAPQKDLQKKDLAPASLPSIDA